MLSGGGYMLNISILPADTFSVYNKTLLNDHDRKLLVMLYQPIIGYKAVSLYFTFWTYLDKNEVISNEWTHHHLMTSMRLKLKDIVEARQKLEAIGLIKTYMKKGNINNYIYELYSPLSAHEFINNPILATALYNNVGTFEYDKIISYFKVARINLKEYEEITSSFNDIFEVTKISGFDHMIEDIKRSNTGKIELLNKIDIDNIISLIPEDMFNTKSLTKDTKDLISKLAFIYDFDEERMSELIRNSLNEKRTIDKSLLRNNCRKFSFHFLST